MLRNRTLVQLNEIFQNSKYFRWDDFKLQTSDTNSGSLLTIKYLYDPAFCLTVRVPTEKTAFGNSQSQFVINGEVCPGELNRKEPVSFMGLEGLRAGLESWLNRIRGENESGPVIRQMREQEEQIAALRGELASVPDEFFSREEAADLKTRLDDLERRLIENLKKNTKDKNEVADRISQISADIQMLKDTMNAVPKSSWAGAVCSRAFGWLKDPVNRQLITSGAQVATELLLDAGSKSASSGQ